MQQPHADPMHARKAKLGGWCACGVVQRAGAVLARNKTSAEAVREQFAAVPCSIQCPFIPFPIDVI